MTERILMIEDDARLAGMLTEILGAHGFESAVAGRAEAGLARARAERFDAVILDVMLPDLDGFEVLRRLRRDPGPELPIVMLTARGEPADRIVGLELGADDYLPKPFEPRELVARLRAVLRRRAPGPGAPAPPLRLGDLEIDREARMARIGTRRCALTSYQFELLRILAERAGRVVSRDALMQALRGDAHSAFDRSIDVHVSRIRAEIEDDPRHPRRLLTVRGVGYQLVRPPAAG